MKKNRIYRGRDGIFLPALLCTMLWGSAIPLVKNGYTLFAIAADDAMAKLFFAGLRFTFAGLFVLVLVAMRREAALVPRRASWPGILALSAAQTIAQYFFLYLGLGKVSGVRGSVLSATSTFFAVVAAHLVFADDRMTLRKILGCALGFGGVLVIVSGASLGGEGMRFTGEGFVLLSAMGQGVGAVISRQITPGQSAMVITGWQLTLGGAVLLLLGLAGGGAAGMSFSLPGLALLGYLVLVSAAAFSVWTMLLSRHPVGRVTVFMFLIPVFGALISALVLQENVLTMRNFAALALVCTGVAVVNLVRE